MNAGVQAPSAEEQQHQAGRCVARKGLVFIELRVRLGAQHSTAEERQHQTGRCVACEGLGFSGFEGEALVQGSIRQGGVRRARGWGSVELWVKHRYWQGYAPQYLLWAASGVQACGDQGRVIFRMG